MYLLAAYAGLSLLFASTISIVSAHEITRPTILSRTADVKSSYDYIVIGGGTSGLTVADRLTEDGKTSVLVVEYGELSQLAERNSM